MSSPLPDLPRYQRVKDVLQRVLDVPTAGRSSALDAACDGDRVLQGEVESLLAAHDEARSAFLESPLAPGGDESTFVDGELDLAGSRLGAYRLDRLLGHGGMGAVYLAFRDDGEFAKRVAVKVIRPSIATPTLLKRFRGERQILAEIEHPHIARLLDGGTAQSGMPFFVMEFVEGETLAEILRRGPLPLPRVLRLAAELADVLALIHSKGLVFRDLKPSNVMLDAQSSVKVLDFGIAKIIQAEIGESSTPQTQPGWIVGSPNYMSPEQATGEPAEASSDVFAFGIVLFEALTGRLPFDGATRRDYYRNLISADAATLPNAFPRQVRDLVERCLRKVPRERYASGAQLLAAVRTISKDSSGNAAARRRIVWLAVAALSIAIAVWLKWVGNGAVGDVVLLGPAQPLVAWASDETNARVSPDLKWIAFISDRDGSKALWVRDRASGEDRVITPPGGELVGYVWSPSSDQIAYVTRTSTKTNNLLNISQLSAGAQPQVFEVRPDTELVRWIGGGIYLRADKSLWRFDLGAQRSREVTTVRTGKGLRAVDVSADERHIVFTDNGVTFNRLWYADIDGGNAIALTDKPMNPRGPRWVGRRSDAFVYVSEENGQDDIWLMDVPSRIRKPLTISAARESLISVSDDGSLLLYDQITESAVVAEFDPLGKAAQVRTLTPDNLTDLFPSASAAGHLVAFERDPTVRLIRDPFTTEAEAIGSGYAPEVSADGMWVAYLVSGRTDASLRVYNVQERNTISVNEHVAKMMTFRLFPAARTIMTLAWLPTKPQLYFVAEQPAGHMTIQSVAFPSTLPPVSPRRVADVDDPTAEIRDLRASPRGNRLSYVLRSKSRAISELRVVNLDDGTESVRLSEGPAVTLTCLGWAGDDAVVMLRSDANMKLVDVLALKTSGDIGGASRDRPVGQLRDVDPGNMALDPRHRVLYFTRTDQGTNSLYAFRLDTQREQIVRQGERHAGAFSGLQTLEDGRLLFSLQKRSSDIYSNTLNR